MPGESLLAPWGQGFSPFGAASAEARSHGSGGVAHVCRQPEAPPWASRSGANKPRECTRWVFLEMGPMGRLMPVQLTRGARPGVEHPVLWRMMRFERVSW